VFLQDRNDLPFRVPLALHRLVLSQGQTPVHPGSIQWGNVPWRRIYRALPLRIRRGTPLSSEANHQDVENGKGSEVGQTIHLARNLPTQNPSDFKSLIKEEPTEVRE
jgi:hypothetical protein